MQGPERPLVTKGGPPTDSKQELFLILTIAVHGFYQSVGSRRFLQSPVKSTADRYLDSETCSRETNRTHQGFCCNCVCVHVLVGACEHACGG